MLISTKGRYALRIMIALSKYEPGTYVSLPLLAQNEGISEKYLESIISLLSKAKLVTGMRGKSGGYKLNRNASEYTVGEILRAAEGSLAPVACLSTASNECERSEQCSTLPLWENLDNLINNYLDSVTLLEIASQSGENSCGC